MEGREGVRGNYARVGYECIFSARQLFHAIQ